MAKPYPIIFLVSSDAAVVSALEADLGRRFRNDTRIVSALGAAAGLEQLETFAARGQPVALLIAEQQMLGMTGVARGQDV